MNEGHPIRRFDLGPRMPLRMGEGNCHYLIFLDKEAKGQKGQAACPGAHSSSWSSWLLGRTESTSPLTDRGAQAERVTVVSARAAARGVPGLVRTHTQNFSDPAPTQRLRWPSAPPLPDLSLGSQMSGAHQATGAMHPIQLSTASREMFPCVLPTRRSGERGPPHRCSASSREVGCGCQVRY